MLEVKAVKELLLKTKSIVSHHKEKEILNGERFNIFSILKMETRENATHSAFLAELLCPRGTHLKQSNFLSLFLDTIGDTTIDVSTAAVQTEWPIGERNDIEKNGGRIDIYIWDKSGNSISIENKIYAPDQFAQVERYCNHNKATNKVYYLTLHGTYPSIESMGELKPNNDFFIISYKTQILKWLTLCEDVVKEIHSIEQPIQQYIKLIKKLTNTMENMEEDELIEAMLNNFEEASFVAANFIKAKQRVAETLRKAVIIELTKKLPDQYVVIKGDPANQTYSQIWIRLKDDDKSSLYFGIESFSGLGNFGGQLYIGVFNNGKGTPSDYAKITGNKESNPWWINIEFLKVSDSVNIKLNDTILIGKLHASLDYQNEVVSFIVEQVEKYLQAQTQPLLAFLNKK